MTDTADRKTMEALTGRKFDEQKIDLSLFPVAPRRNSVIASGTGAGLAQAEPGFDEAKPAPMGGGNG